MIVGFLLICSAFLFFLTERKEMLRRRVSEYKELLEFVAFVDFKLKTRAFSLYELMVEFLRENTPCGKYLSGIKEVFLPSGEDANGKCDIRAFFEMSSDLAAEDELFLKDFFQRFGKTELDMQRRQASDLLSDFKERAEMQIELAEKKIRSQGLIFASSFLGALILFI